MLRAEAIRIVGSSVFLVAATPLPPRRERLVARYAQTGNRSDRTGDTQGSGISSPKSKVGRRDSTFALARFRRPPQDNTRITDARRQVKCILAFS